MPKALLCIDSAFMLPEFAEKMQKNAVAEVEIQQSEMCTSSLNCPCLETENSLWPPADPGKENDSAARKSETE